MSDRLYGKNRLDGYDWYYVRRNPERKLSLLMRAVKFTIAASFMLFYGLLLAAAVSSCSEVVAPTPRW